MAEKEENKINKVKGKTKGFIQEFKEFALKGNVLDMAIGVIIGGAFGKIVTSLVDNIIMPLVSLLIGKVNFTDLMYTRDFGEMGKLELKYGLFLQNVVDFLIVALCIFVAIKAINKLATKEEEIKETTPEVSSTDKLLIEIRDIIKEEQKDNKK